jgi:hypothetical protein
MGFLGLKICHMTTLHSSNSSFFYLASVGKLRRGQCYVLIIIYFRRERKKGEKIDDFYSNYSNLYWQKVVMTRILRKTPIFSQKIGEFHRKW